MQLRIAKILCFLVVLLVTFDLIGAAVTACADNSNEQTSVQSKKPTSSIIVSFLIEKAEEEEDEKAEEKKTGRTTTVLADLSRIAISLSLFHTHNLHPTPLVLTYDVRPSVHSINCVFLI
jgi:hypothetical protein